MLNENRKSTTLFAKIWKAWLTLFVFGLLIAIWQSPAKAAPSDDKQASQAVIEAQLDAFRKDDAKQAFEYAAPSIQRAFGSPDNFVNMVKRNYDVVYRPASVRFIRFDGNGAYAAHAVQMIDQNKVLWNVYYELQRRPQGDWRISGCEIEKAETDLI